MIGDLWFSAAVLFYVLGKTVWPGFWCMCAPLAIVWLVHWGLPNLIAMMKGGDKPLTSWGEKCRALVSLSIGIGFIVFLWTLWGVK